MTQNEIEEFDDLNVIVDNIGTDVCGEWLHRRYRDMYERMLVAGMIYCPYIPLQFSIRAIDPNSFEVVFHR